MTVAGAAQRKPISMLLDLFRGMAVAAALVMPLSAVAAPSEPPRGGLDLRFNESLVEAVQARPDLDIEDVMATFGAVFAGLDDEVQVYPTENYYYFTFYWGGAEFGGNMRLDAGDRDDGILHFAYFARSQPWTTERLTQYRPLSAADGVEVGRRDALTYAVTYEGRTVLFHLNDLSDVEPPAEAVRADETYIGPVFDESGMRFYLLFDETRRDFLFVLDESEEVNDVLVRVRDEHPALTVGLRTGFAFYEDRFATRKILVGVSRANVEGNTYYDGPFDQLPDNFVEGDEIRRAIVRKYPDLDGKLDRFGGFLDRDGRFLVAPYANYSYGDELEDFLRCADPALDEQAFYGCVLPADEE